MATSSPSSPVRRPSPSGRSWRSPCYGRGSRGRSCSSPRLPPEDPPLRSTPLSRSRIKPHDQHRQGRPAPAQDSQGTHAARLRRHRRLLHPRDLRANRGAQKPPRNVSFSSVVSFLVTRLSEAASSASPSLQPGHGFQIETIPLLSRVYRRPSGLKSTAYT